jgi:hypothetical protein
MNSRIHLEVMPSVDANQFCKDGMIQSVNRFRSCNNSVEKRPQCLSRLKQESKRGFGKALDIDTNAAHLPYCKELYSLSGM